MTRRDEALRALDPRSGEVLEEHPNPRPGGERCGLHDTPDGSWMGYQRPPVIKLRRCRHYLTSRLRSVEMTALEAEVTA